MLLWKNYVLGKDKNKEQKGIQNSFKMINVLISNINLEGRKCENLKNVLDTKFIKYDCAGFNFVINAIVNYRIFTNRIKKY